MSLLATTPEIAFPRDYPYERKMLLERTTSSQGYVSARDWEEMSLLLRYDHPEARYYAEKTEKLRLDRLVGVPVRILELVRDPRDVWASIQAFDEKRGFYGFGRRRWEPRWLYRRRWVSQVLAKYDRMLDEHRQNEAHTVRYEDLAQDRATVAEAIGSWLGVSLVHEAVPEHARHRTTENAAASVGRWVRDLGVREARWLTSRLEPLLSTFGYLDEKPLA